MDPVATSAAVQLLTGLGLPGLVIGVLGLALRHVFKLYTEAQEKRINEAADNRTAIERNTAAFTALSEWIKDKRS